MESELVCNHKKCRKRVECYAWVTSCSHIFCDEDGIKEFNSGNTCPACSTELTGKLDIIRIDMNPSENYKSMVLAGQKPEVVMEICSRAMSFWSYQTHQERVYQEYVGSKAKERAVQLEQYYEQIIAKTQGQLNSLKSQLSSSKKDLDNFRKKYNEASDKISEKNRQYQKLQSMYDALKKKCITTSTFDGGDVEVNDKTKRTIANFTLPVGSGDGYRATCVPSLTNSKRNSPLPSNDYFSFRPSQTTPVLRSSNQDHFQDIQHTKNTRNQTKTKNKNTFNVDFIEH